MPPGNNVDSEYKLRVEGAGIGDVNFCPDHHDHHDHLIITIINMITMIITITNMIN